MHTLPMPVRRACAICGRKEAAASLHLTTVLEEGQPTRACDQCRDQLSWFCQSRNCRKEQVGSQHVIGGLALCGPCARPLEAAS